MESLVSDPLAGSVLSPSPAETMVRIRRSIASFVALLTPVVLILTLAPSASTVTPVSLVNLDGSTAMESWLEPSL